MQCMVFVTRHVFLGFDNRAKGEGRISSCES